MSHAVFAEQSPASFGQSILPARSARRDGRLIEVSKQHSEMRGFVRKCIPAIAGVYGFYDRSGQLIYVGKAKRLKQRLLSYFIRKPPGDKAARIAGRSSFLRWEVVANEFLALLREQELISRFRPVMNRRGQPKSRTPKFLAFSREPAPRVEAVRPGPDLGCTLHGPILGGRRLRNALVDFNHAFRLRDCGSEMAIRVKNQQSIFDQFTKSEFLSLETEGFFAPGEAVSTETLYGQKMHAADRFLRGDTTVAVLCAIERSMREAAAKHSFEWAAQLRDRWENLKWLAERLSDVRLGKESYNAVYPLTGIGKTPVWLFLCGGAVAGAASTPRSKKAAERVMEKLHLVKNEFPPSYLLRTDALLLQLIVLRWLRNNPHERRALMSVDDALDHCRKILH